MTSTQNIVVLGAGKSGVGAAVLAHLNGQKVLVSDALSIKEESKKTLNKYGISWEENGHSEQILQNTDKVVISPGIPITTPFVKEIASREIPIVSEIEFAYQYCKSKKICITGSNGKTTTKTILNTCIKNSYGTYQNFNNEIGLPLCALELDSKNTAAIFEMGAAKLGDIDLLSKIIKPNIGIITHIGHSHLEGLNSVKGVLQVKSELIKNIKTNGSAIVPNGQYVDYWKKMRNDIVFYTFGQDTSASFFPSQIRMTQEGLSFFIESIHLNKKVQIKTKLISLCKSKGSS